MDFWDRMKNALDKGLQGSRDLLSKARDRAQDLGERGVLRFEILQLENQAESLVGKLGARAYEALITEKRERIDRETDGVRELIAEIDAIHERIREKEAALELAKRKDGGPTA